MDRVGLARGEQVQADVDRELGVGEVLLGVRGEGGGQAGDECGGLLGHGVIVLCRGVVEAEDAAAASRERGRERVIDRNGGEREGGGWAVVALGRPTDPFGGSKTPQAL